MRRFRRMFLRRRFTSASARAARRSLPTNCSPRCATDSAGISKSRPSTRAQGDGNMSDTHSDALVFFGATGDLAYKKIFPSLQAMVQRGHLDAPVIGVAKAGWNLEQLESRGREGVGTPVGMRPEASITS